MIRLHLFTGRAQHCLAAGKADMAERTAKTERLEGDRHAREELVLHVQGPAEKEREVGGSGAWLQGCLTAFCMQPCVWGPHERGARGT